MGSFTLSGKKASSNNLKFGSSTPSSQFAAPAGVISQGPSFGSSSGNENSPFRYACDYIRNMSYASSHLNSIFSNFIHHIDNFHPIFFIIVVLDEIIWLLKWKIIHYFISFNSSSLFLQVYRYSVIYKFKKFVTLA